MKKLVFLTVVMLLGITASVEAAAVNVYDDDVDRPGRYVYAYPDKSSVKEITYDSYEGSSALEITLDPNAYSGAAIGNYPIADLTNVRDSGAVEFWVRGNKGGELFQIALIDSDNMDGTKAELRLPVAKYVNVSRNWQKVSIPLAAFGDEGVYWDGTKEVKDEFDWYDVVEIKFMIPPLRGHESFTIYVDEVKITE